MPGGASQMCTIVHILAVSGADRDLAWDGVRSNPALVPTSPAHTHVHPEHLNTPRLVADQNQQTVWKWDQQEPFGNSPADENPSGLGAFDLPLRFPGQYYDKESGLHQNVNRDFDPSLGIYKQSDPLGLVAGLNTYAYVRSSPLSFTDPEGLNPVIRGLAAALALAKATKDVIEKTYNLCKNVRCKFGVHTAHHYFGWPFNRKMCHVQLDCYIKGVKGSKFLTLRFPYSCDGTGGAGGAAAGAAAIPTGPDDGDDE